MSLGEGILSNNIIRSHLIADDHTLINKFRTLYHRESVASLLEVSDQYLRYVLYGRRERQRYTQVELPKSNGKVRLIEIPPPNLRHLQRKLLRVFDSVYKPRRVVTGFVRGRSIVDNALPHIAQRNMLNCDIADFFPTIHIGRVAGMLMVPPYSVGPAAAFVLGQICCHDAGHLPQGAPTSPIVANMICSAMDSALLELSAKHRCIYTRYADDITLSTTQRQLPLELINQRPNGNWELGEEMRQIIQNHGFHLREEKTRARDSRRRQRVTGIVVNEFPNVPRQYISELRALINDVTVSGLKPSATKHAKKRGMTTPSTAEDWIQRVIVGKLGYLKMVRGDHDPIYRRLARAANRAKIAHSPPIIPLEKLASQPLRRRSTRACDWRKWVKKYRHAVFQIECRSRIDKGMGSAFQIASGVMLTAGHNCEARIGAGIFERTIQALLDTENVNLDIWGYSRCERTGLDIAILKTPYQNATWWHIPTQERLPEVGEEVAAIGYPTIPLRHPELVLHVGHVESVGRHYSGVRYLSVSFPSGPGLSGSPLIDANGFCLGIMVENTFLEDSDLVRPYGQAIAVEHWRDLPGTPHRISELN